MVLTGFVGFIVGIFLLVLPQSFFNFWMSIAGMLEGEDVLEYLKLAVWQVPGIVVTGALFYFAYSEQGFWVAVAFIGGLLWPLWTMIWNALTAG